MADLWESAARFLGLVFVDLLLAGDNAVVIALAARRLQGRMRRQAILLGAGGAVALRLALAAVVTWLLQVPLLQAVGGLLLLWIARKLVVDDRGGHDNVREAGNVWEAVQTIILADVVMSLDNVLALVGVSGGHLGLLVMGLALSVPLIVWGSSLLSGLMDRWPWLIYVGAGILVWVAVEMVLKDRVVHEALVGAPEGVLLAVHIVATLLLTGFFILQGRRPGATPTPEVAEGTSPATSGTHASGALVTDEPGSDGRAPRSQRPQVATGRKAPTEHAGPAGPAPASRPGGALTRAGAEPARPGAEPRPGVEPARPGVEQAGTPVAPAAAHANHKPQGPRTGEP